MLEQLGQLITNIVNIPVRLLNWIFNRPVWELLIMMIIAGLIIYFRYLILEKKKEYEAWKKKRYGGNENE